MHVSERLRKVLGLWLASSMTASNSSVGSLGWMDMSAGARVGWGRGGSWVSEGREPKTSSSSHYRSHRLPHVAGLTRFPGAPAPGGPAGPSLIKHVPGQLRWTETMDKATFPNRFGTGRMKEMSSKMQLEGRVGNLQSKLLPRGCSPVSHCWRCDYLVSLLVDVQPDSPRTSLHFSPGVAPSMLTQTRRVVNSTASTAQGISLAKVLFARHEVDAEPSLHDGTDTPREWA